MSGDTVTSSTQPTSAADSAADAPSQPRRTGRLWPPPLYWFFLLAVVGLNVWTQTSDSIDPAIVTITFMLSTFLASMTLLVWLALFSGHGPAARRTPIVVALIAMGLTAALFRLDHVTSDLRPVLVPRWQKHPDQLLGSLDVSGHAVKVPLNVTTPDDFPQFLGPTRSAGVDRPKLARDWGKQPPQLIWKHAIGAGHSGFVVVNGFAVTMEQRGDEELVTCYDALTGRPKWSDSQQARHETKLGGIGPRATPTIDEGRVYALGATGVLRCLDGTNGRRIWIRDLLAECDTTVEQDLQSVAWGRAASPLIVDSLVVVPGGGPANGPKISLLAFDKKSGQLKWKGGDQQIAYASPSLAVLDGMRQILTVNETTITGHDPLDGAVLWEHPWPGVSNRESNNSQVVPVGGDRLWVSKAYNNGASLFAVSRDDKNQWTAKTIWSHANVLKTKFTNAAIHNGYAYGLSNGILECADVATGKSHWKQGHYGAAGQLLRVGDLLLVESDAGEVALVESSPDDYHELGRFQAIDGLTWNTLCLWGSYLLVRNSEEAACYQLPVERR